MNAVVLARTSILHQWPGVAICVLIALASTFVATQYGGPQLLYALMMGMSLHFLYENQRIAAGIDFSGRTLLRIGVALLGARITLGQVADLGWMSAIVIVAAVFLTIGCGILLARVMKRRTEEGVLSGGAVAICGASAALAISAALPQSRENERTTLLMVVGVTIFSTLAMILYPFVLLFIGLDATQSGIFLGGTIHDVAQVVAAGMLLGPETADTATVVKLFRVLLLMPIVLIISIAFGKRRPAASDQQQHPPMVPLFLLAFIALVIVSSTGVMPASTITFASDASRWLLVIAIAAAGVKTPFEDLLKLGWQPVLMLLVETAFIALLVLAAILVLRLGIA